MDVLVKFPFQNLEPKCGMQYQHILNSLNGNFKKRLHETLMQILKDQETTNILNRWPFYNNWRSLSILFCL